VSDLRGNAKLSPEQIAALAAELAPLATLQDVVRWGFAHSPPREIVNVVVQDEFWHDVVVTGPEGLYLSFDTT
jgi:hypothetical protein